MRLDKTWFFVRLILFALKNVKGRNCSTNWWVRVATIKEKHRALHSSSRPRNGPAKSNEMVPNHRKPILLAALLTTFRPYLLKPVSRTYISWKGELYETNRTITFCPIFVQFHVTWVRFVGSTVELYQYGSTWVEHPLQKEYRFSLLKLCVLRPK